MSADDVPDWAMDAAVAAVGQYSRASHVTVRAALAAVLPRVRAEARREALAEAERTIDALTAADVEEMYGSEMVSAPEQRWAERGLFTAARKARALIDKEPRHG